MYGRPSLYAWQINDGTFSITPSVSAPQRSVSEPPADWYSPEQIEKRDRPLKDSPLDPGQILGGALARKIPFLIKAAVWTLVKAARKAINAMKAEPPPKSPQEAMQKAQKDHVDRMREPRERAREQAGIDRREHRERMEKRSGRETMRV